VLGYVKNCIITQFIGKLVLRQNILDPAIVFGGIIDVVRSKLCF
jgi:hypothetical protein